MTIATRTPINADAIPLELRERAQWVCWRYEQRPGEDKPTKVPRVPWDSKNASTTDPKSWRRFDHALSFVGREETAGVGFVFSPDDPYTGVDLDDALDTDGEPKPWTEPIIAMFTACGAYIERSPSGRGLHIITRATLTGSGRKRAYQDGVVEMYDRARFFTFTGDVFGGRP
jgi:putative DNA primase/helicase